MLLYYYILVYNLFRIVKIYYAKPILITFSQNFFNHFGKEHFRGHTSRFRIYTLIDLHGIQISGYFSSVLVTRKEYESETCSDDDNMELPEEKVKLLPEERKKKFERKKASKEMEKKVNAAMKKPKHQSSMTDFFKRK